jgi:calcineurin-like phosphoesterase family protein
MKKWITADIHFGHANILKFCAASRPFFDTDEMDETIIKNWNALISFNDIVYILGDVAFANADRAARLVNRLNGTKILVKGNHDTKILREPVFRACFAEVHDYLEIGHAGSRLVMFHFPIWEWDRMHHGAVHFHGHCHGRKTGIPGRIFDVAMDANNCLPHLLDDAIAKAMRFPVRNH